MSWRVHIEQLYREARTDVFMLNDDSVHGFTTVLPVTLKVCNKGDETEPMFTGYSEQVLEMLQAIVDAAYEHGIRPKGMGDLTGELGATKFHLSDMRELVLKLTTKD